MADVNAAPTVFVVDDDPGVREGLCILLASVDLRAETYGSAEEFLDAYDPARPGCLVADVRMPSASGLELQETLAARGIELPVIIISGHGDIPMAVQAIKAGALDFIEKPFRGQDLLDRIQAGVRVDAERRAARARAADTQARLASLTPRERQVLDMLVSGQTNKAIATDLNLSHKTIEFHRTRLMEKMGAESLVQLVRLALTS